MWLCERLLLAPRQADLPLLQAQLTRGPQAGLTCLKFYFLGFLLKHGRSRTPLAGTRIPCQRIVTCSKTVIGPTAPCQGTSQSQAYDLHVAWAQIALVYRQRDFERIAGLCHEEGPYSSVPSGLTLNFSICWEKVCFPTNPCLGKGKQQQPWPDHGTGSHQRSQAHPFRAQVRGGVQSGCASRSGARQPGVRKGQEVSTDLLL